MKTIYLNLSIVFFAILFSSCDKDSSLVQSQPNIKTSTVKLEMVESKVTGFVYDMEGNPLGGVKITFGIDEMISNDLGWFYLEGQGNNVSSLLKASKAGYFDAFPAFTPQSGVNKLDFRMEEKKLATTFDASKEYKYTHENGSVSFQKESIRYENGEIYTGDVNVYMQYFDPTSEILYEIMPGNLYAQNRENDVVGLVTYGMVNVELESPSGEKLNLSKEALIRLKLPEAILSDAPSIIPLWHFDENSGLWQEEGKAILKDDYYEGTVSHFSSWNCDDGFRMITIKMRFLIDGLPMNNKLVILENLDFPSFSSQVTDENGNIQFNAINRTDLVLKVKEVCSENIFKKHIGPFVEDDDIGDILIIGTDLIQTPIFGKVALCSDVDIESVKVVLKIDEDYILQDLEPDGSFLFNNRYCKDLEYRIEIYAIRTLYYTYSETQIYGNFNSAIDLVLCEDNDIEIEEGFFGFWYKGDWIKGLKFISLEVNENTDDFKSASLRFYESFITNDTVLYKMTFEEEKIHQNLDIRYYKILMEYDLGNNTYTRLFDFEIASGIIFPIPIFELNESGQYSKIRFENVKITDKTTGVIDKNGIVEINALTN